MHMRYSDQHVRQALERAIVKAGSLRQFARNTKISPTFVSMVRRAKVPPGAKLAAHLGFQEDGKRWVELRR